MTWSSSPAGSPRGRREAAGCEDGHAVRLRQPRRAAAPALGRRAQPVRPVEVDRLARRGRPRRRSGSSEVTIESGITALGADRPYFRGRDALVLARSHRLEEVAELLWTGRAAPPSLAAEWDRGALQR
jgi:hypothetical protein